MIKEKNQGSFMSEEKKIGLIPVAQVDQAGPLLSYVSILITNKRLIVGWMPVTKGVKAATAGFGVFGHFAATKSKKRQLLSKYVDMNPEEFLKAHKDNYEILFEDIDRVELGKNLFGLRRMRVYLRSGKKKGFLDIDKEVMKELPAVLQQVIEDKLVDRT